MPSRNRSYAATSSSHLAVECQRPIDCCTSACSTSLQRQVTGTSYGADHESLQFNDPCRCTLPPQDGAAYHRLSATLCNVAPVR
jgi:hypothetical protein